MLHFGLVDFAIGSEINKLEIYLLCWGWNADIYCACAGCHHVILSWWM
jgi:hypothetical protein